MAPTKINAIETRRPHVLAKLCGGVFKCLHTGNTYKGLPDKQVARYKVSTVTSANFTVASANLTVASALFAATSANIAASSALSTVASAFMAVTSANVAVASANISVASAFSAVTKTLKIVASALYEVGSEQKAKKGDLLNHPSFKREFV